MEWERFSFQALNFIQVDLFRRSIQPFLRDYSYAYCAKSTDIQPRVVNMPHVLIHNLEHFRVIFILPFLLL